ncbi:hypothetical protein ACFLZY_01175 [Patescibacteria group bacterium]
MGTFREFGNRILKQAGVKNTTPVNQVGITGTGWPNTKALRELGYKILEETTFKQLGIDINPAPGHDCSLVTALHLQTDEISKFLVGRAHLYQNLGRYGEDSPLRQYLAVVLAGLGDGNRITSASAVGGQGDRVKDGMVVMPSGIHAVDTPSPHLLPGVEFSSPEIPLLDPNGRKFEAFARCAKATDLVPITGINHRLIQGPRFGNRCSRQAFLTEGCETVGMSLVPLLDAVEIENRDRPDNPIKVMPLLYVTDAHDYPNADDIIARAKADSPKLTKFFNGIVQAKW